MQPHKRTNLLCLYRGVKEKVTIIVARTLVYERRKRVARTGTELLPLRLASTVESLLMATTSSQM